jgi:hypothetical protein
LIPLAAQYLTASFGGWCSRAIPISVDETLVQFDYFMLKDGDTDQENQTKKVTLRSFIHSLQALFVEMLTYLGSGRRW